MIDPTFDDLPGDDPVVLVDGDRDPLDVEADYDDSEEGAVDGTPVRSVNGSETT